MEIARWQRKVSIFNDFKSPSPHNRGLGEAYKFLESVKGFSIPVRNPP
jgi:hypothetical protein